MYQHKVSLVVRYFMIPCNICLILLATSTLGFAVLLFLNNCRCPRARGRERQGLGQLACRGFGTGAALPTLPAAGWVLPCAQVLIARLLLSGEKLGRRQPAPQLCPTFPRDDVGPELRNGAAKVGMRGPAPAPHRAWCAYALSYASTLCVLCPLAPSHPPPPPPPRNTVSPDLLLEV